MSVEFFSFLSSLLSLYYPKEPSLTSPIPLAKESWISAKKPLAGGIVLHFVASLWGSSRMVKIISDRVKLVCNQQGTQNLQF